MMLIGLSDILKIVRMKIIRVLRNDAIGSASANLNHPLLSPISPSTSQPSAIRRSDIPVNVRILIIELRA
tara:strand:- start:880 stop:1089 length:210 start_codon:yes stop_codon:yes gene_type:complete